MHTKVWSPCRMRVKIIYGGSSRSPLRLFRMERTNNIESVLWMDWSSIRCLTKKASPPRIRRRVPSVPYVFHTFVNVRIWIEYRQWTIRDLGNGNVTLYNMAAKKYLATKRTSESQPWQPVLSERPPLALMSTGSTREEEIESAPWRIEATSEVSWSYALSSFLYAYPFKYPFDS